MTYVPDAGFTGSDSFVFAAFDGARQSPNATEHITVEAAPVAPAVTASTTSTSTTSTTAATVLAAREEARATNTLPFTGGSVVTAVLLGGLLIACGGLLVGVVRTRRRTYTP